MDMLIQDLSFDPARTPGLSERLLRSHHQNNYGGAVKRLNDIRRLLEQRPDGPALNGLKREELIATNSMLLHELYFDSLGGAGKDMAELMAFAISTSFGSVERWREEFTAMGRALAGGSGWVLLSWQAREGRLVNQWAADHSQSLAGGVPILALDMYEHAYHLDHGAQAAAYVEAFMANIAWDKVCTRYQRAVHAASSELAAPTRHLGDSQVLDVRRASRFEQAQTMLPGAVWRDPLQVNTWAVELPRDRPVVVYCIHGHEVSRCTAMRLRAAGIEARFLAGGIEAWTQAGLPLTPRSGVT